MDLLARYELIISQALTELNPPAISTEPAQAAQQHGELAFGLGDILYRLSIEHGVPFNQFRQDTIDLLTAQRPVTARAPKAGGKGQTPPPFAASFAGYHPTILLALETMPQDLES